MRRREDFPLRPESIFLSRKSSSVVRISLANSSSRSLSKWSASSNFIWQIYGECFSIKKSHFSSGRVRENRRRVRESESEWKMLGKFLSTEILRESEEAEKRATAAAKEK